MSRKLIEVCISIYKTTYDYRIGESPWRSWRYPICIITHGLCSYNVQLFNDDVTVIGVSFWPKREFPNYARLHRDRMYNSTNWTRYSIQLDVDCVYIGWLHIREIIFRVISKKLIINCRDQNTCIYTIYLFCHANYAAESTFVALLQTQSHITGLCYIVGACINLTWIDVLGLNLKTNLDQSHHGQKAASRFQLYQNQLRLSRLKCAMIKIR